MSTDTTVTPADLIVPGARMSLGYLMSLTKDVPADRWADPGIDGMNHPAFLYGHLAIYPNRVLGKFLGREDLVKPCSFDEDAVAQGAECKADASLYPTMDEVLPFLQERYETTIGAIAEAAPDVFGRENPAGGRFTEMLPTVGAAVHFMMGNHIMMHAGQMSHWRRGIGLGPAS